MTGNIKICFEIDAIENFVIELQESIDTIDCCSIAKIFLFCGNKKLILSEDLIKWNIEVLYNHLTKAINGSLPLHTSIGKDIGFLANEERQKKGRFIYTQTVENAYWVGLRYKLWDYFYDDNAYVITWLYNDAVGEIVFEVTLLYRWDNDLDEEVVLKSYIPYEEWINNYKPILKRTISKETAQKWLNKTNMILNKIEENT